MCRKCRDLTLSIVSKVGVVDEVSSQWYQKKSSNGTGVSHRCGQNSTIGKTLHRLADGHCCDVPPRDGIIHGNIKPENLVTRPSVGSLRIRASGPCDLCRRSRTRRDVSPWRRGRAVLQLDLAPAHDLVLSVSRGRGVTGLSETSFGSCACAGAEHDEDNFKSAVWL